MSRRRATWGVALLGLCAGAWGGGCFSEEIIDYPRPDGLDEPDAGADAGETTPGDEPIVGMACEQDDECPTGTCMTTELIAGLGLEGVDVPGGMCTTLFCAGDEECGPGGFCFDTTPFTGTAISICLLSCEDLAGCRWADGYSCYYEEEIDASACLPDGIIVGILCDDGHCDGG